MYTFPINIVKCFVIPIVGDIGIVALQLCDEAVVESRGSSHSADVFVLFLGDALAVM
jgi:hypothetical protein